MLSFSNGLCLAIMGGTGFGGAMDGGVIRIYSGTRPANANYRIPSDNVHLATVTTLGREFLPGDPNTAGLRLRLGTNSVMENLGVWVLTPAKGGVAKWFRWNWRDADPNDDSGYYPRIDGDVGLLGTASDMLLEKTTLVVGQTVAFDLFLASL